MSLGQLDALMALWFPYVGYLVMAVFMGSRMSPSIVLTKGSVLKMENLSLEAYPPGIHLEFAVQLALHIPLPAYHASPFFVKNLELLV